MNPFAPTVSASKTDSLFTDVDGDNQADPGDTLKYTVNISAAGQDATGVTFTDTVDPNTTFVGGTLRATPVAVNDSYSATGNVRISVAAPGVLGNDFTGLPSATITGAPSTSANGGDVTLNADGSFTYNPPAGFEGNDSFTYTLTNSEGSNPATVNITVSGMIWFINNNASACTTLAAGCGRLTNPFSSLSAFAALNNGSGNNPAANDNIFVYESGIDYAGPVTLLSGQKFIGQDATASLSSITGLTPPAGSDPLPATNSGNGTIVNITTGNAITVASGNTLTGFTGGDSTTDITGSGFGTLTISDVTLNGTGQALNLSNGTLAATFVSISSTNSATTGITLSTVAGTLTIPSTTVTNPTGSGISVLTSSGALSFGNTTVNGSGATGVVLGVTTAGNTGTISFGALNIAPDAGIAGLSAADNTNTITTTSGTINSTTATAVNINRTGGTTPLNMTLTSVSSSGGSATGMMIQNTTGSFTVVGDGTNTTVGGNSSGGTIANKSGADGSTTTGIGVYLNNAMNITLRRMTINGTNQNFGIRGTSVTGVSVEYSTVNGSNGDNAAPPFEEGSIIFDGLFGTSTFTNNAVGGSIKDNFRIRNSSGSSDVTVTGSTFSNAPNDNMNIEANTTANVTAYVTNNTFTGAGGDHFQTITSNSATLTVVFTGNNYSNGFAGSLGGGITISGGNAGSTETVNFNISNNGSAGNPLVGNVQGGAINVSQGLGGGTWQGQVSNNFIGNPASSNSGSTQSSAIRVENHSATGTMKAIVSNNTLAQWATGAGINFQVGDTGNVNAAMDLTVTGNNVNNPGTPNVANGVLGNFGANAAGTNAVCFDFQTNTVNIGAVPPNGSFDLRLRQRNGSTVRLPGYVGANTDTTAVANFEIAQNTLTANAGLKVSAAVAVPPGGGFVGGAACSQPTVPSQPQNLMAASSIKGDALQSSSTTSVRTGLAYSESVGTLRAAQGEKSGPDVQKLTQTDLAVAVQAAIERWRASGISSDDFMRLQSVTFEIADLPDGVLATAASGNVKIDETAAGYAWFVDVSSMEDSEFAVPVVGRELQSTEHNPAFGHMDLLTVVMRQLGVTLQRSNTPLMQNTLSPATRRLPNSASIQSPEGVIGKNRSGSEKNLVAQNRKRSASRSKSGSTAPVANKNARFKPVAQNASRQNGSFMHHAPSNAPVTFADVMLSIGTLPAGESVTITFNVTVNNPFTGSMAQVSNQGTVSGTNFADVLTDDPTVGGTADPTVTPIDLPNVSVAVSPASVLEDGPTNLVYTFTRSGSTANAMTVNFSVGGSASFTEPDYTQSGAATFSATSGTVVIPSGSSTAAVTVDPSADTTVEPDETVDLTVTSGTGYTVGSPSVASGTITNDDTDVSIAVSPASVAEDGATNLVYTLTRTGVTTNSLTVNLSVGGTATSGASPNDYTQTGATSFTPPTATVTFAPGSSTAMVTVDPETDSTVEPDETVVLTVTAGTGYNVGSPSTATGTITNDDTDVSVTVSPSSVAEDGATNLVYTFTRTGVTASSLTVNFSVGGTATFGPSPDDYTQTGATTFTTTSGSVTFAPGSSTAMVTVNPEADATPEPDETVVITLAAGAGYNVVSPSSATGTILNDDTLVSVAVSPASTPEGGNLVYTFTRTGSTGGALTVNFSVGGTASFPSDYSQSGAATFTPPTATVTFGAGSSTATVTVMTLSDCLLMEGPETVEFTVQPGTGYGVGSPSMATGTITDVPDSTPPTITLSTNTMSLWPPDHTYTTVSVTDFVASASDNCDPNVDINDVYILKITSDEAENGAGDGNTLNDIVIAADCKSAQLRAERAVSGNGRVYTITFKVVDASGNFTTATVTVTVPPSINGTAVDDGPSYTVNSLCP